MSSLNITSEVGTLKRVILHSPGPEIEAMTPKEAEADLYNDIIPLSAVRGEFDMLKAFLDTVAKTYEVSDLLARTLADTGNRFEFLSTLSGLCPIRDRIDELMAMSPDQLARGIIQGIPAPTGSLSAAFNSHSFSMRPLPNAYFMRDSAAIFRDCAISSATAFDVRLIESLVTRFIFIHHPDFHARSILFDGPRERNRFMTLEGGDVLVISPGILAIGISERTTPDAVQRLAASAAGAFEEPVIIFAVLLPRERATIHLDMVFTMVDRDAALVYAPVVLGRNRARVIRLDTRHSGEVVMTEVPGLIEGLKAVGVDLDPVFCGSGDNIFQEREQWWSGANSFAFSPGQIVMYSCNTRTVGALSSRGFAVRKATDFISGAEKTKDFGRLVVTFDGIELARGGGGARCMTMPVERENL
ncbi:MAG: arginine deiminase family protein [Rectinemataceae bacterium]|nr:arginine deiminase family protein [Rectinemataceae bacterium]